MVHRKLSDSSNGPELRLDNNSTAAGNTDHIHHRSSHASYRQLLCGRHSWILIQKSDADLFVSEENTGSSADRAHKRAFLTMPHPLCSTVRDIREGFADESLMRMLYVCTRFFTSSAARSPDMVAETYCEVLDSGLQPLHTTTKK